MNDFVIKPAGDRALSVIFRQEISDAVRMRVAGTCASIAGLPYVTETVPAYATVLVYYDALKISYSGMKSAIEELNAGEAAFRSTGKLIEIPVCYGGAYGEDIADVAAHACISTDEVIRIHSGTDYPVYFVGFLPGFPYLGGLDERLHTPRRSSPRTAVPAGSVAIGGKQTGVYPSESPGGWHLIGRTPMKLFDAENGALCRAGDTVRFVPITEDEYNRWLR